MKAALEIFCDEAGHTGPDLLHGDQRYFSYASVNISNDNAWEIIQKVRTDYRIQMPELKANKLIRTNNGRLAIRAILAAVENNYAVNIFEKILALGGWLFEYIYEPVYKKDPTLLYEKDLHRFVAMFVWLWFTDDGKNSDEVQECIRQFQNYMRTRDPSVAPFLFDSLDTLPPLDDCVHPFHMIQHFSHGYKDRIIADNNDLEELLPESARWTLDLSTSALWSHLNHWGRRQAPLIVTCDESKPLQAYALKLTGDENDPAIRRQRMKGNLDPLGWKLVQPIVFSDSRNHPALQLADVLAGATVGALTVGFPEEFQDIPIHLQAHMLQDTILPDLERVDLKNRICAVNTLILFDLAKRAQANADPHYGLAEMYREAEVRWVKGEIKF